MMIVMIMMIKMMTDGNDERGPTASALALSNYSKPDSLPSQVSRCKLHTWSCAKDDDSLTL